MTGTSGAASDRGGNTTASGGTPSNNAGGTPNNAGGTPSDGQGGKASVLPDPADVGWRDSKSPFCSPGVPDVWSDERGVYTIASDSNASLAFNSGDGWVNLPVDAPYFAHITGFVGGPLLIYGGQGCGIRLLENGVTTCSGAASNIYDLFTVTRDLAYGVTHDRLMRYDGEFWTQVGDPYATVSRAVWASADRVAVAAHEGHVYLYDAGESKWFEADGLSNADNHAIWGFAKDDVFVGTAEGELYRFDGSTWSLVWAETGTCLSINGMWGAEGVLYFHTSAALYRLEQGEVQTLLDLPCGESAELSIVGLWGNGVNEVFITGTQYVLETRRLPDGGTTTERVPKDACGEGKLLWFDGTRLRWL